MKILVLSDSHGLLSFMRQCIEVTAPDAVIHLGDYYRDGQSLQEEFPQLPFYQVPGNCDLYKGYIPDPEIRLLELFGVRIYMTHGHRHNVKLSPFRLISDARAANAQLVLYGHTHIADCRQEEGLWILNPGAASWGGSAAVVTTQAGRITNCKLLTPAEVKNR